MGYLSFVSTLAISQYNVTVCFEDYEDDGSAFSRTMTQRTQIQGESVTRGADFYNCQSQSLNLKESPRDGGSQTLLIQFDGA